MKFKKFKHALLIGFIGYLPMANGWLAPVDFNLDSEGDKSVNHKIDIYNRCDTPVGGAPINECHRWNLVWSNALITDKTDWKPEEVGAGSRLPTIKELTKMFDYTGATDVSDPVGFASNPIFNSWLSVIGDNSAKMKWLISSSYRDIDGSYNSSGTGRLQIFAINIATGQVRTFEPGQKGGSNGLDLCVSLASNGDCTLEGGHTVYNLGVKIGQLVP